VKDEEGKKRQGGRKNEMISGRNGEGEEKREKVCVLFGNEVTQICHVIWITNKRCMCCAG
jgi:hypothetical protein